MYRVVLTIFVFLFSVTPLMAARETVKTKEVVVTATKLEEPTEETTSEFTIINSQEIENMKVEFVPEILKRVPDLNLTQNGGPGKSATVLLRGGSPNQVMVMIDGVKVKSTTLGQFDFSGLSTSDIERIEIIKGPQSTIYGSEAMSGVINIITKKGRGKPNVTVTLEGGSFGTYSPALTVSGGSDKIDYRVTGDFFHTDGISAAKKGSERDEYENASGSAKVGLRPARNIELEVSGRYSYDRSELDGFGVDDLNYIQHGHHYVAAIKGTIYFSDMYEQILLLSRVEDRLRYRDPDTSFFNSDIDTSINTVDWQHNLYLIDEFILTFGAEYREEEGKNIDLTQSTVFDEGVDNKALYINNKIKLFDDDLVVNAGLRFDDHETFGNEYTYRIGGVYNVKAAMLKVKGSYGTGFRAPTLNELFYKDPFSSGNINLEPERTSSWEIGLEKEIVQDRASVSVTYFDQNYKNLIEWVETPPLSFSYLATNVSRAEVKGIEARLTVQVIDEISLSSSYTYLDTENKNTGEQLKRRPKDKLNVTLDFMKGPVSLLTSYTFVGKAFESASRGNLSSYSLVEVSGSYAINNNVKLFARVENLLDQDYETAAGFNSPGFSAFGGVEISLM